VRAPAPRPAPTVLAPDPANISHTHALTHNSTHRKTGSKILIARLGY
jgi:hypothetical protein